MTIFTKKKVQTSNDLYEAYKDEISGKSQEQNNGFSFSKILKLELLVLALGLFVMNQSDLSLELKKMYVASTHVLPVSIQSTSIDNDLVVTLSEENFKSIEIREEDESKSMSNDETYVENDDIRLLIELLNAEFDNNKNIASQNRIVISQK